MRNEALIFLFKMLINLLVSSTLSLVSSSRLQQPPSSSSRATEVQPFAQLRWLPRWRQPSPAAGGWRWRRSSRTCFSLPCCWAGVPCSSCSSQRASTPTSAKDRVSRFNCLIPCVMDSLCCQVYCSYFPSCPPWLHAIYKAMFLAYIFSQGPNV